MTKIMEGDPDDDGRSDITPREARKARRRVLNASEVHPMTFNTHIIETDGATAPKDSEISEKIKSWKLRQIQQMQDDAEMADLTLIAEQKKQALEEYRARNKPITTEPTTTNFEPATPGGKSFMNDPAIIQMIAGMPLEKQEAFFKSAAAMEMAEKNPQMAMFSNLMATVQRMSPQQAQQTDPLALVATVTTLQKTLRESDPMYQQMQRYAQEQQQYGRQGPVQTDPNSLTGILEKKIADKIASASIEELFGGAKPASQNQLAAGGAIDAGTGLFLDEETGMYIPKHVNYEQYLDINTRREQRLSTIEENESKERQMKMLTDNVVTPLIARAQPLIDAVINKASTAIVTPSQPLQSQQVAPSTPSQPAQPVKTIPPGIVPPEDKVPQTESEDFECLNCHNQWKIYPDARGIWPTTIKCESCGAYYNVSGKDASA